MAYNIELMSIGNDLYPLLEDSAALLNAVQQQFRFSLTSPAQRAEGVSYRREEYSTADIWAFLKEQRKKFGGNRPYIIGFVNAPLKSSELGNLFGSHEAGDGLATVTIHSSTQYVKEARRYCCYYLTRYSLSFVNPLIKSHDDPKRKNCYFHKKLHKPDIRASMDTGYICDVCRDQLDNPPQNSVAKRLSDDERQALQKMRDVVSGNYPYALIMKGGGVKGLAFAGALLELEKYFWFDCHVGASAGAIAAVLLAAGYSPAELVKELREKDFRDFMDAPMWRVPINLLLKGGCYPGDHFCVWITELLGSKFEKQSDINMSDLNGAIIYATRSGSGTLPFDSVGERKDTVATFAARCSMSIPLFFIPPQVDGRRVYDGGLRNNFPVSRFLTDHPGTPFVALYLSSNKNRKKGWMGSELLDIWIDGEERKIVDANADSVVVIDTSPVGTVDFNLQPIEKDFLIKVGRASALTFLQRRNLDNGPTAETVKRAREDAEESRIVVLKMRKQRRVWRVGIAILVLALISSLGAWSAFRRPNSRQPQPVHAVPAPSESFEVLQQAAEAGNADSMDSLGNRYQYGLGVVQDYAQARKWYEKAAAAGNASGMAHLGYLYLHGQGVPPDYQLARLWFDKAVTAGSVDAIFEVGYMYHFGRGVPTDYRQARERYEKAAAAGSGVAMEFLGLLYQQGQGVPQDYQKARQWYERAAAAGRLDAMDNLGYLYQNGLGVDRDIELARKWYERAAAGGNKRAQQRLRMLPPS